MKKNKILSVLLTGILSVCLLGSIISAAEEEKIYTYAELVEMTDEEFLNLDDRVQDLVRSYTDYISSQIEDFEFVPNPEDYDLVSYRLIGARSLNSDSDYIPHVTEKKILELFEGFDILIFSPLWVTDPDNGFYCLPYGNLLKIYLYDESTYTYGKEKYNLESFTQADIIDLAKFEYCIDQIVDLIYFDPNSAWTSNSAIKYGDVDDDGALTIKDCDLISQNITAQTLENLNEVADFNCDGEINMYDVIRMEQFISARQTAENEGYVSNELFYRNFLENSSSSTTPAETTPTETTTTTISTTVTTELTTEPAETTTVTTQPTTTSLSELTTTTTTVTTITTPQPTEQAKLLGDADGDNEVTVRDCSFIALTIAQGRNDELSDSADFNADGEVNVRDAAAIAKNLAQITN